MLQAVRVCNLHQIPHAPNGLPPSLVTEITIEKCLYPSALSSLCYPKTTPEQDAIKGKWVRVERDLNAQSGLWSLVSCSSNILALLAD